MGKQHGMERLLLMLPQGTRRSEFILFLQLSAVENVEGRWLLYGCLTKEPMESVYSRVVSLRGLRVVMFLAELNKLLLWGGDAGNAYLEALAKEKLNIIAGPEFGKLQGHILIIHKALYGTRTGGAPWHDKLFNTLQHMGFQPKKADPDIWMKPTDDGQAYDYIAVYVDDLCVASKDHGKIYQTLKNKYKFELQGDGPLDYHLGCSYK